MRGRLSIECFFCKSRSHVAPLCKQAGTQQGSAGQLSLAPSFIVSTPAVTTKSLPAKTSVLCPVVRLGVLVEDCSNFQDVNFLIDTGSQISLINSLFITKI